MKFKPKSITVVRFLDDEDHEHASEEEAIDATRKRGIAQWVYHNITKKDEDGQQIVNAIYNDRVLLKDMLS